MATWTYDEALRRLLAHEGGYTNHPSDPGGPTNFGITIHDYRKYVKPNATAVDVRAMTVETSGHGILSFRLAAVPGGSRGTSTLVRLLPQWSWTRGTLSFVYPSQPFVPAKVRTFIDLALASSGQPAKRAQ